MPELPEVEGVRRTLEPLLLGRLVADATLHTRAMLAMPTDPAGGFYRAKNRTPGASAARPSRVTRRDLLVGGVVRSVLRHGKQLAIVVHDGRAMAVHLGMTGQLLFVPPTRRLRESDHVHATWKLAHSAKPGQAVVPTGRLVFRDPRRFGGVWAFPSLDSLREARWRGLGPDALSLAPGELGARVSGTKRPIKAAIMDQGVIAGVGNIYADEACFLAGVNPNRRADRLTDAELERLAGAVREVLERSVTAGGSTLRDYVDATGRAGGYQAQHAVYGRGGEPCLRCGRPLLSGVVGQRTTVWCVVCQPLPAAD